VGSVPVSEVVAEVGTKVFYLLSSGLRTRISRFYSDSAIEGKSQMAVSGEDCCGCIRFS
jgi:hypothetical protein